MKHLLFSILIIAALGCSKGGDTTEPTPTLPLGKLDYIGEISVNYLGKMYNVKGVRVNNTASLEDNILLLDTTMAFSATYEKNSNGGYDYNLAMFNDAFLMDFDAHTDAILNLSTYNYSVCKQDPFSVFGSCFNRVSFVDYTSKYTGGNATFQNRFDKEGSVFSITKKNGNKYDGFFSIYFENNAPSLFIDLPKYATISATFKDVIFEEY